MASPTTDTGAAPPRGVVFRYEGYDVDPGARRLTCRYSLDGRAFAEVVTFPTGDRWDDPAVDAAARWVFLLAGVSYYKTAAPPVVELPTTPLRTAERDFLRDVYVDGLGEFAYRNGLDLSDLRIEAADLRSRGPGRRQPGRRAGRRQATARPLRRRHRLDRDRRARASPRRRCHCSSCPGPATGSPPSSDPPR